LTARRGHAPCDATPYADALRTPDDAYVVQMRVARGMAPGPHALARFWKSGGPSREAALTHAALPSEGVWASPADARAWPFHLRLIEAEVALRLGRTVTPADAELLDVE